MKLASKRKEAGLTQEDMSKFLGVGVSTYNQYENSQRSIPSDVAAKIAQILQVPHEQIFLPIKFTVSKLRHGKNITDSKNKKE